MILKIIQDFDRSYFARLFKFYNLPCQRNFKKCDLSNEGADLSIDAGKEMQKLQLLELLFMPKLTNFGERK